MPRDSKKKSNGRKSKDGAKRHHGGQPGNKNAEKHGFYSRRFTAEETSKLNARDRDRYSLDDEIDLLTVYLDRIAKLVTAEKAISEQDLKTLNTLALMAQGKSTLIRTHYLVKGKGGLVEQTILEALEELRLEMGL